MNQGITPLTDPESPPITPVDAAGNRPYPWFERSVLAAALPVSSPAWQAWRQQAHARLQSVGLPQASDEAYKYSDLRYWLRADYDWSLPADAVGLQATSGDITLTPMAHAWETLSSRLQALLQPQADTDPLTLLNWASVSQAWVLHVPRDATLDMLDLVYTLPSAQSSQMLLVLLLEPGARLTCQLIGEGSSGEIRQFLGLSVVAELCPGSRLTVLHRSNTGHTTTHMDDVQLHIGAGADARWTTMAYGVGQSRHRVSARLLNPLATAQLNGLTVLSGEAQVFHHTDMRHLVPDTRSEQLYKGIVADAARTEFNGTVTVSPHAQKTQASQLNKHLLLSRQARVWSRPQLQIHADDVKCSHGASVGQLPEDALFYLASRGIDRVQAQTMLTMGFARDVLDHLPASLEQAALPALQTRLKTLSCL